MNVNKLIELLGLNPNEQLHIMLPSQEFVPSNFHITEVGLVKKTFIDCGGTLRESNACVLQVWTANDTEHRLLSGKLFKILNLAKDKIKFDDLPVEIEYGVENISQFSLLDIETTPKGLLFVLGGKFTDCLAPDKCGVTKCCNGVCK